MSADEPRAPPPPRPPRYGWPPIALVLLIGATIAVFAWATFWPLEPCAHPSCARNRFALAMEVDALEEIEPIAFNFHTDDGAVSLQSILATGGIDLAVTYDDLKVPYKSSSGPLDRADLYQFVSAWRNRPADAKADARLYALFTAGLISDKGEPLFGIMFDYADREAFAVAPRTTERFFGKHEPQAIQMLQLRTFIHELLHALNRDHEDAATMADGRLTLEAPTRCIARARQREWTLVEAPLMALSPATIRFFQTASSRDVLPGKGNSPYAHRRSAPAECESARANVVVARAESQWQLTVRQLKELFAIRAASAAEQEVEESEVPEDATPPAAIELQAQPAAYPLGYPIAVRVSVTNTGEEPLPLKRRLNPGYGLLQIEYRVENSGEWRALQPLTWFEPTSNTEAVLEANERTEETIPIYFGEDGWTFPSPGDYEVRARLRLSDSTPDALSDAVPVSVIEPQTDMDRAALAPLLNAEGELDVDLGRLLSFGGRIGRLADMTPLESITALYGETSLGSALRLTLLSQRLRPAIDPRTGVRPLPDFSDARSLLEDTCTDSGVAAMTSELLEQRADVLPAGFRESIRSGAAAWDGTTSTRARTLATYSDDSLSRWGPSLHFCARETTLRRDVAGQWRSLARQLAREQPARIVVVGHGDRGGTCRDNDALALRRAESVRGLLIESGIPRQRIETVSLGERRPVDFSASTAARDANRRVEILIEGPAGTNVSDDAPLMPNCSVR